MKALTGLPTSAYLKVAEEAKIQLADLLQLVQHLEAGASPAYLARYRPDVSARLSEAQLRQIEARLREFLDLEDRRIMVLTAIRQQNRMTPELQKKIEETTDRHELEDYYLPFKPKRRTPADEAKNRAGTAGALSVGAAARRRRHRGRRRKATSSRKPAIPPRRMRWRARARLSPAGWARIPRSAAALRPIMHEESELIVSPGDQPIREDPAQKQEPLAGRVCASRRARLPGVR